MLRTDDNHIIAVLQLSTLIDGAIFIN